MPDLTFLLAGARAKDAAAPLGAVLTEGESVTVSSRPATTLPESVRKMVDPVALAGLILAVPSAVLAVAQIVGQATDLLERRAKRRKAQALLDEAKRLTAETGVETYLLLSDGTPRPLAALDADEVLEIAARVERDGK